MKMRLDKFLTATATASRSESAKAAKQGRICINGVPCGNSAQQIDAETDVVEFDGQIIKYKQFVYIMLNKPQGYVSATEDQREKTVLELLPEKMRTIGLFPCGRLDKNTIGLMLLTNNGDLGHKLLSPKYHVTKRYRYTSKFPLSDQDITRLEQGVSILDGYVTLPASVYPDANRSEGEIEITEGKYHQIKLMFDAIGNKITSLERVTFGPLTKDPSLKSGEWRELSDEEIKALENHCNVKRG